MAKLSCFFSDVEKIPTFFTGFLCLVKMLLKLNDKNIFKFIKPQLGDTIFITEKNDSSLTGKLNTFHSQMVFTMVLNHPIIIFSERETHDFQHSSV